MGNIAAGPDYVILVIATLQFAIFGFSLWAIFKLWMSVIEFLGNKSTVRAKTLASILGGTEIEGTVKKFKLKAIGTGLGGTALILVIAVFAMYVVGNHVVT